VDKKFEIRQSILGLRGSFGAILDLYLESNPCKFKIVTADTAASAGLSRFKSKSPDSFIECGISEQSATAIASAIALENYEVYLGSFSPFIVGRSWEQIRLASYMNTNMTIFGFGAGIGLSYLGFTHCSLEDCSLINSIPCTTIFEPSSPSDIFDALKFSKNIPGIKYIRLTGDGPISKKLFDGFIKINQNMKLYKKNKTKLIICSGYLASRLIESHSENYDFLTINQISNLEIDFSNLDFIKDYKEIYCFHESYENFLAKLFTPLKNLKIQTFNPKKVFSKPGDYNYVSKNLDFDINSF